MKLKLPALRLHRTDLASLSGEAVGTALIVTGALTNTAISHNLNLAFHHDITTPILGVATWVTLIGSKLLRVLTNPARGVPPGSDPTQHVIITPPMTPRPLLFPNAASQPEAPPVNPQVSVTTPQPAPLEQVAAVMTAVQPTVTLTIPPAAPSVSPPFAAVSSPLLAALLSVAALQKGSAMPTTLQGQIADAVISAAEANKTTVISLIQNAEGSVSTFITNAIENVKPAGAFLPIIWSAIKPSVISELVALEAANPGAVIFAFLDAEARQFAASLGG